MSKISFGFCIVALAFAVAMPFLVMYVVPALASLAVGAFLHFYESKNKVQDATLLARVEHLEKAMSLTFGGRR